MVTRAYESRRERVLTAHNMLATTAPEIAEAIKTTKMFSGKWRIHPILTPFCSDQGPSCGTAHPQPQEAALPLSSRRRRDDRQGRDHRLPAVAESGPHEQGHRDAGDAGPDAAASRPQPHSCCGNLRRHHRLAPQHRREEDFISLALLFNSSPTCIIKTTFLSGPLCLSIK